MSLFYWTKVDIMVTFHALLYEDDKDLKTQISEIMLNDIRFFSILISCNHGPSSSEFLNSLSAHTQTLGSVFLSGMQNRKRA